MRPDPDPKRLALVALVCVITVAATVPAEMPVRAQSDGSTTAQDRRCLPDGGWDLTIGDSSPRMDVTVHTSLFTNPSPPSALGLAAQGVAVDAEVVKLRTGVLLETTPEGVSPGAVRDALVVVFDYRLSLPMFEGATGESVYEPTDGPVSGVETRRC